ncbi:MAG: AbrB/MazE/SpoVT family DNA-binding domain-containing protein [Candidatus Binatia bacterium]
MARKVKDRRPPRLSSKNQATIPVSVLREAGISAGDALRIEASGPGEIKIARVAGRIERFAGCLPGTFPKGLLEELRREWRE